MAVPKVSYKPNAPVISGMTPLAHGSGVQDVMAQKAKLNPRAGQNPLGGSVNFNGQTLPNFAQPNIGQGPNGNTGVVKPKPPVVTYNPSGPVSASQPPAQQGTPVPTTPPPTGSQYGQGTGIMKPPVNGGGADPRNPMPSQPPVTPTNGNIIGASASTTPPVHPAGYQYPTLPEPTQGGNPPSQPPPTGSINATRQNETPQQRIDRLRAKGDNNAYRSGRIQSLRQKVNGDNNTGGTNPEPSDPTDPPVQLDNDPSTWKTGDLAELAPPVGATTYFRDQGKSAALTARKKAIRADAGKDVKGNKKNTKPAAESSLTPTAEGKKDKKNKKAKAQNDAALTDKQKKNLKKRPQPGTPARPYISRGVSYNPIGYGGSLRV